MCLTGLTAEFQETSIRPLAVAGKCGWEDCRGPPGSPPRSHRFSPQQTMGEICESQAQKLPKCKCWAGYKNLCSMQKKEIAHVHCSPTIYTVWFCFNPTLTLSFWLVKWVVVCICVDPVCWIQGFKCRSYSVVLRICFTWNSSDGNQMKMPTGWKICRKPHGFRLFPWTNPAKKASKRSKPKNFSSQLPSGLP